MPRHEDQGADREGEPRSATAESSDTAADTATDEVPPGLRSTHPAEKELPLLGETVAPASIEPTNLGELRDLAELPLVDRGRYIVEAAFAQGGIGTISRARDVRLDRTVALKELRRRHSSYARVRFAREIRLTARLSHPNIVPLYEAGRWPSGEPFFAMKLVEGSSLDEAIEGCAGRQERMELLGHVADVADAIAYAHSQHVVHRDLKPANVLVGPFGETVVIDWGLARDTRHDSDDLPEPDVESLRARYQTTDGAIMGTPPYMPPEQAAGRLVDERGDVYALGAILYHLLGGRVPYFEVPPREILDRVVERPPTPLVALEPELPPDLLAIVSKAMARNPADRYRSAREMADELRLFRSGRLVGAYTYSFIELAQRFVSRHRAAVVVSLLALAVLVGFGAWSFGNIADERDRAEEARRASEASALAEASARAQAEERLEQTILAGARAALLQDPTLALALLAQLERPRSGAPTVAADAVERGVAERILTGQGDRVEIVAVAPDGRVISGGLDGTILVWQGRGSQRLGGHTGRISGLVFSTDGRLISSGYDGRLVLWNGSEAASVEERDAPIRALATRDERAVTVSDDGVRLWRVGERLEEQSFWTAPADRPVFAQFAPKGGRFATGSHHGAVWLHGEGGERVVLSHPAEVKAIAFAPSGDRLATACSDGKLRIFAGADEVQAIEAHRGPVETVAFVDENRVATGGFDGAVILWDLTTGEGRRLVEHGERVVSLVASPDGQHVATGSWDKTVALARLDRGTERRLRGHRDVVSTLAFSPDGTRIVSGSWDREARVWAVGDRDRLRIEGHPVGVKTIAFSPDGSLLASGGHDDTVRLWRTRDGVPVALWRGHHDHVFRVVFSPDGDLVASSSDDFTVRLWSVQDGEAGVLEGHRADVEELAFSADGAWLASAGEDDAVGLWDVREKKGKLLVGHRGAITDVAFSPKHLASASRDGTVRFWRLPEGIAEETWDLGAEVAALAFSPDQSLLAAAAENGLWLRREDDGTRLAIEGLRAPQSLVFSPDGKAIAVGSARGALFICSIAGKSCRELTSHDARIHALQFTPDGRGVVSGSGDGTVRVWDVQSGESAPMRAHGAPVFDVAVASDGSLAASASGDMTITLWKPRLPPAPDNLAAFIAAETEFRLASP